MSLGAISYFIISFLERYFSALEFVHATFSWLTPLLIFTMLLLTFSKISLHDLLFKRVHFYLVLVQLLFSLSAYFVLLPFNKLIAETAMICLLMPTATAAAVVTCKLGGSISFVATYTLLINCVTAIVIPLFFPFIEVHKELSFLASSSAIISKVFPLLLFPFILALLIRRFAPKIHGMLLSYHTSAFYLWAVALVIVTEKTTASLVNSQEENSTLILLILTGLLTCLLQFFVGKKMGDKSKLRVSTGQALGQKNTILAIWIAQAYLNPLSALGPGSYVIWQNSINAWQLWKKQRTSL